MFCIQILLFNDIWSWILQAYCTTDFFPPFLFSPVPRFCEWLHYADFLCVCGSDNRALWSSTSTYMRQVWDWHDYIPVLFFLLESVPHSSFDLLSSFSVSTCSRLAHLRYAFLYKAAIVLPLMPGLAWLTCFHVMWWNGGPYHSAPPPPPPPPPAMLIYLPCSVVSCLKTDSESYQSWYRVSQQGSIAQEGCSV